MAWQGAVGVRTLERVTGGWCQWGALRTNYLYCICKHATGRLSTAPPTPPRPYCPLTPPVPSASPRPLCEPLACMPREYSSPFACCAFC